MIKATAFSMKLSSSIQLLQLPSMYTDLRDSFLYVGDSVVVLNESKGEKLQANFQTCAEINLKMFPWSC